MNKKRFILGGLAFLSLMAFSSCTNNQANTTASPTTTITQTEVKDKYTESAINVYYKDVDEKHNIRLYEKTGKVPYLGIKDYYKILLKNTASKDLSNLAVVKGENGKYKLSSPRGYDAYIDVNENTLFSENLTNFVNTSGYLKNDPVTSYDGMPFVKFKYQTSLTKAKATLIDFDDYHIDVFGDDNDVYLPIQTLSDIFNGMNLLYAAYNTKDLYIVNTENDESLFANYPKYNDDLFSSNVNKAYMEYAYNEFCLFYDYFQERTGRTGLEKTYDLSKGINEALESDEFGQTVKGLLTSGNKIDYLVGVELLRYTMFDGGHTVYTINYAISVNGDYAKWITQEELSQVNSKLREIIGKGYEALKNRDTTSLDIRGIRQQRQVALTKADLQLVGTNAYTEYNSLAMIHIDDYMTEIYNRDEWNKYYNGERATIPYSDSEGGAVAALYKGFENARANSNIKTVIIDIGANSGGSSDELMYLINFLTGNDKFYMRNLLSDELIEATLEVDKNLDGKFDANDKTYDPVGDLKVIVLTSESSFSCGGISPVYLHDLGLKVIGENCGGGSCAIVQRSDGLGFYNAAGTYFNFLSPKRKASIDYERFYVCDYFIPKQGDSDYSKFYDLAYLENLVTTL